MDHEEAAKRIAIDLVSLDRLGGGHLDSRVSDDASAHLTAFGGLGVEQTDLRKQYGASALLHG